MGDLGGDSNVHSGPSPDLVDGHRSGDQSPSGSVVWPTSIRWPSGSRM